MVSSSTLRTSKIEKEKTNKQKKKGAINRNRKLTEMKMVLNPKMLTFAHREIHSKATQRHCK